MTISYSEHYKKYLSVYKELSTSNNGHPVWIPTDKHDGWYVSESITNENSKGWKEGYPKKSRPSILPDDLSKDVERTAYTTISYAPKETYNEKYYKKTPNGIEWLDNSVERLPNYEDIVAWSLFVDIDIGKEYKTRPLPDEHKEIILKRLKLWIKAYSSMTGGIENVLLLDSGGGVYVFTPTQSLSPIADEFSKEERGLIYNEIGKRMRKVVGKLDTLICEQDTAPNELFSADKVQNVNRQFKTIGSIHKSLNAVVHPIKPKNPTYQQKKIEDITNEDITDAKEWAEKFTSKEYKKCISNIITYLFQGQFVKRDDVNIEYVEGDNWEDILTNWVTEKKKKIEKWEVIKKKQEELSQEVISTEITQNKDISREAIRRVNNEKLKSYIINFLGEEQIYEKTGSNEMDIFPFWRASSTKTGRSAFYDEYRGKARFTDKSNGASGDIVYWVALEMTYDDENYPDTEIIKDPEEELTGKQYRMVLQELRNRGEQIPIYIPELKDDTDKLSNYHIIQTGLELGLISEQDVFGSSEQKVIPEKWNMIIDKLNDEDINHNRKKKSYLTINDITPPIDNNLTQEEQKMNFFEHKKYNLEPFESIDEYKTFFKKKPKSIIAFEYDGKIKGGPANGLLLGSFISENRKKDTIKLHKLEINPLKRIDSINTPNDLTIDVLEEIDKTKMRIILPYDTSLSEVGE